MTEISREIREIGRLIDSTRLLMAVRNEVARVLHEGFVVTDGCHCAGGSGYDVVVECGKHSSKVARRIRANISNVNVDHIATGILGIKTARRGRNCNGV
jgi:hypothetical protein